MDLHRLGLISSRVQNFVLVARLGSIRQAAKALNVAPSSISRTIKQLEEDLTTPLFERSQQRLKLTSAGELLYYHIRQSTGELNRAITEINDLQGLRRGTVSIAVIESATRGFLPDVLASFWIRHPEISVDVRVGGSPEVANMLLQGEADLAIAFDVRVPRNARRIASVALPMGVMAPPGSRLATKEGPLRVYDLAGERVILSDSSLTLGSTVEEAFSGSFVEFSRRARTNSIGLMIDLAARGLGTILQTRMGVEREIERGDLVFVPLADSRLHPRRLQLLSRPKSEISEAASVLANNLAQAIERMAP
ncbi:LysR family transcriptional regulator [Rubellimicrobium arenae]|uniref:LysR family transcriptional regulator n=1 Tax=Rubellimicrobium arenae TaxID=2817372 RepID=UPI001B305760|nr:LysR family transcriptional regulator [Rubellimicrobium arenae]